MYTFLHVCICIYPTCVYVYIHTNIRTDGCIHTNTDAGCSTTCRLTTTATWTNQAREIETETDR